MGFYFYKDDGYGNFSTVGQWTSDQGTVMQGTADASKVGQGSLLMTRNRGGYPVFVKMRPGAAVANGVISFTADYATGDGAGIVAAPKTINGVTYPYTIAGLNASSPYQGWAYDITNGNAISPVNGGINLTQFPSMPAYTGGSGGGGLSGMLGNTVLTLGSFQLKGWMVAAVAAAALVSMEK